MPDLSLQHQETAAGPHSHAWVLSGRLAEDGDSRSFPLAPLPFRIGRRPGLSLTLARQTVSGLHAEFVEHGQRLVVRDLDSTNGTFINGLRLSGERALDENDLVQFADAPFRVSRAAPNAPSHTRSQNACDQALAIVQFDRLISGKSVIPHYQPIVDIHTGQLVAFEVLARSRLVGLETPDFMFTAASQLGVTTQFSQVLRRVAVEDSCLFVDLPHLFLNTHPSELEAAGLLESCADLRRASPHQKITIEIHEAAIAHVGEMAALRHGLEVLDMTLAFDDFGAGQARVVELAEVRPQYIKFDRSMIRHLHTADPSRRRVVESLTTMVRDVGVVPIAEGVETVDELHACIDAGFVLSQGYFHGKPMPATHYLKSQVDPSE